MINEADACANLAKFGIKCTLQRIHIARAILTQNGHYSADEVMDKVSDTGIRISKATIYNTLNLFARSGLVREVTIDPARLLFDVNNKPHHHFYNVDTGELHDIAVEGVNIPLFPQAPEGSTIQGYEVLVKVKNDRAENTDIHKQINDGSYHSPLDEHHSIKAPSHMVDTERQNIFSEKSPEIPQSTATIDTEQDTCIDKGYKNHNFDEALELINANGGGYFEGTKTPGLIEKAENSLGFLFPPSYKLFLSTLGCGDIDGMEFYGIRDDDFESHGAPDAVCLTLNERKSGLPNNLLLIYMREDGAYCALDTGQINADGENPVVTYELNVSQKHIADDFGAFFLTELQAAFS
ncbi:MAG: transcriptional repressor [Gammaproteobacteria bacterium]